MKCTGKNNYTRDARGKSVPAWKNAEELFGIKEAEVEESQFLTLGGAGGLVMNVVFKKTGQRLVYLGCPAAVFYRSFCLPNVSGQFIQRIDSRTKTGA